MVMTIFGYGQPVLKEIATDITPEYPQLSKLLADMWETMYFAEGVGLAAPQVGLPIRLFTVDTVQIEDKKEGLVGIKQTFINAKIVEEIGEPWLYEEGCLSIPGIRGKVSRKPTIRIKWQDENFKEHEATFDGMNARVIQHEYDHIEGLLFTEKIDPSRRLLLKAKLEKVRAGRVDVDYKMKFANGRV